MSISSNDLPSGWARVSLGDVVSENGVEVAPQTTPDEPYLGMEHVEAQTMRLVGQARCRDYISPANTFVPKQVLYGRLRPYLNKVFVPTFGGACSGEFIVLEPSDLIRTDFLARLLNHRSFVTFAGTLDTGDRPRVRYKQIADYQFALPPRAEQDRIMEAVQEEEARLAAATESLRRAGADIAMLRLAVLAELGKTGAALRPVGELGEVFVGATPKRAVPEFWNGDIPWVSSGEVAFCRISKTRETITEAGLGNPTTRLHPPGTVLLAMIGEGKTRGQAAILDVAAAHNQNAASIRLDRDKMLPDFLYLCFVRQYATSRALGRGGQQPALNKELVKAIEVPCPTLDVQEELVEYVKAALRAADDNEADLRLLAGLTSDARTALLRDALGGRLAAQDSTEEPAGEALKRVGAERGVRAPRRGLRRRVPASV